MHYTLKSAWICIGTRVGVDLIYCHFGAHLSSSTSTTHLVLTVVVDWRGRPRYSDFLQQEMSFN